MTSSTKPYKVVAVTASGHGTYIGRTRSFAELTKAIAYMEALANSGTLSEWVAQLNVQLRDYSTVAYLDIKPVAK